MKKSFIAATAGVLAGVTLLVCAAPAMAQPRIGFGLTIGVPVPVAYAVPAPIAYVPPAAVVYGGYGGYGYGYGPAVRVGAPYYYHDSHYYHGYHDYHGYHGWHR